MPFKDQSIHSVLKFYTILLVVSMIIFPVLIGIYDLDNSWRTVERDMAYALNTQSTALQRWFTIHQNAVASIASLPSVRRKKHGDMSADFQSFVGRSMNFDSMAYVNTEGIIVAGVNARLNLDISDRDYFRYAVEGKPYITDVIIGRTSGKPVVIFSVPIMEDDSFQGLVFGSIHFDTILNTVLSTRFGATGHFLLLNSKGMSMKELGEESFSLRTHAMLRSSGERTASSIDSSGKKFLAKGRMLEKTNFFLVARIDYSEFLGPFIANICYFVTVSGVLLCIMLFISQRLRRNVERSLSLLFEGVTKAEQGDYDPLDLDLLKRAPYELRKLGIAFSSMAVAIRNKTSELEFRSFHDELTGLYNRAFFEDAMRQFDSGRFDPVTVVVCDVNGLKLINDTLGHKVGDKLIAAAAKALKKTARISDVVARIGGDEFAILLPESSSEAAVEVLRRIHREIAAYKEHEDALPLNIACGVATTSGRTRSMEALFREADNSMYSAKELERPRSKREIRDFLSSRIHSLERDLQDRERHMAACSAIMEIFVDSQPDLSLEKKKFLVCLARHHDIGFTEIPPEMTEKPGPLTEEELFFVKRHPETGARIASLFPELADLAEPIRLHHCWWNGEGYPTGDGGETIPFESRIMTIVDAYEAMIGNTNYRPALSPEEAINELRRCTGSQFDPVWTKRFISFLCEYRKKRNSLI